MNVILRAVLVGFVLATVAFVARKAVPAPMSLDDGITSVASTEGQSQIEELYFVYLGSSTCPACNDPRLPSTIDSLRTLVEREASRRGWRMISLGLAKDASVEAGIQHLRKMGPFHEISTGREWLNRSVQDVVFRTFRGRPATPQVILIHAVHDPAGLSSTYQTVLARRIGTGSLHRWAHEQRGQFASVPAQ